MGKWRDRYEDERDRRYTDLRSADQRALQIKETADATALTLAAALQAEKDERRNDILGRWNDDRATFVTRETFDAALKPLNDFLSRQNGIAGFKANQIAALGLLVTILVAIAYYVGNHLH